MNDLSIFDVVVVGGGHAGCEAAHVAARMGCRVALITQSLDTIALMPCNPAVGGPAKGHVVAEIDALGGLMGIVTDKSFLQMRMLNTAKGPAVRALRAQSDKRRYQSEMKKIMENTAGLHIFQALIEEVLVEQGVVKGVRTQNGALFLAPKVIITAGTYFKGRVIVGGCTQASGPNSLLPSIHLSDSLQKMGIEMGRFKTGTPPRIHRRSADFSLMIEQPGDSVPWRFSFSSTRDTKPQLSCWLTYTTAHTHEIIRQNLHRSPLYSGIIEGTGPRYCPSIEDKVVRFADKPRHQIFLEPEGFDTDEMYVQGFSTSLPEELQHEMLRSVIGLHNVEMMRPGYAIEYDYILPTQLKRTLETKVVEGLFSAGQVNGSSGYEEAAGQGLMAGINAAASIKGTRPIVLSRTQAYIGVLIDDLVTKGTQEPYRLMTSRAEHRLLFRMDNARNRLLPLSAELGLTSPEELSKHQAAEALITEVSVLIEKLMVGPTEKNNAVLIGVGSTPLSQHASAAALLRRPAVTWRHLVEMCPTLEEISAENAEKIEIAVKYAGYISKELELAEKVVRLEAKIIPASLEYKGLLGLSNEAKEKLS
ncbi:MAG: tRNA uridine-5-carboxymethylaminomethyl(34) synthesis enzyme MnmG, partial [bacterium]|nr:tRNA uridine-5-carboxymethylaminomethyl(34) synthesis enzyme MnmG [bacterium]